MLESVWAHARPDCELLVERSMINVFEILLAGTDVVVAATSLASFSPRHSVDGRAARLRW